MKFTRTPSKLLSAIGVAVTIVVGVAVAGGWVTVGEGLGVNVAEGRMFVLVGIVVGVWVGESVAVAGGGNVEGTVAAGVQAARNNSAVKVTQNKTRQDMPHSPIGLVLPIKNTTGQAS